MLWRPRMLTIDAPQQQQSEPAHWFQTHARRSALRHDTILALAG